MEELVNELISYLKIKEKLIGILIYGSYTIKEQDEYSDIDVLIVLDDKYTNECGRGVCFKKKHEIEFFIETEDSIYKSLLHELDTLEPINRNRFLMGEIIIDKDKRLEKLKNRAQQMQLMPYTPLSKNEIIINSIFYKNKIKNLKRKIKNNELDKEMYYYDYLSNIIRFYYRINCKPIIFEKMYKTLISDEYRNLNLQCDIEDEYVKNMFLILIKEINIEKLEELVNYILKDRMPNENEYRIYY
jgi:predicted nucleotidyltransferase